MSQETLKTLIYPGAGWNNIINYFPYYNNFILIDTLPKYQHYKKGQPGYKKSKNKEVFFKTLVEEFGEYYKHDEYKEILYFRNNVQYWYNCNASLIRYLPPGDILIRGYSPSLLTWSDNYKENRIVYVSCDHYKYDNELPTNFKYIHFHVEEVYCCLDDTEEEDED